jgi:hypothetical protein
MLIASPGLRMEQRLLLMKKWRWAREHLSCKTDKPAARD